MKASFIVLLAALATSAAQAQGPTGMKAGLWETRTTAMSLDGKDMLPQMLAAREEMRKSLASLPPEVLRATCVDAATRRADVVTAAQMQAVVDVFGGAGRTSSGR